MALVVVYWYDFICFGIIGVSAGIAFYVLLRREGSGAPKHDGGGGGLQIILYESLLVDHQTSQESTTTCNINSSPRGPGHLSFGQLWTTCWRGLQPIWLLGLRFASFVILSGFLAWDIHVYDTSIFVYYTEWTYLLVIVYFVIGTVVSVYGCMIYYLKKTSSDDHAEWEEKMSNIKLHSPDDHRQVIRRRGAGFWVYVMQTAYQTCAGAVILTDIVFWCIIVPFLSLGRFKLNMVMGCMHTLNAVFLLLDTSINNLPFPWYRLSYFVLWSCCYVIFQWIIHACGFSWWPYPFLELTTSWAPLWYMGLAVLHIPCYGLYYLVFRAKSSLFPKLFPNSFVRLSSSM